MTRRGERPAVLVTGGSGMIGRHVTQLLARRGHPVVCLYRHTLPVSREGIYPVCSDMSSADLLAAPLRDVETVIHLAWATGLGPDPGGANKRMLTNLITAMSRARTRRLVLVSACGVTRDADHPFLNAKYEAEHLVVNSPIPEKVVVRPSIVCSGSPNDRLLRHLERLLKVRGLAVIPDAKHRLAPMHVDDLAAILADCCQHREGHPAGIYESVGESSYSFEDMLRLLSKERGGRRFFIGGALGQILAAPLQRFGKRLPAEGGLNDFIRLGSPAGLPKATALSPVAKAPRGFRDAIQSTPSESLAASSAQPAEA